MTKMDDKEMGAYVGDKRALTGIFNTLSYLFNDYVVGRDLFLQLHFWLNLKQHLQITRRFTAAT